MDSAFFYIALGWLLAFSPTFYRLASKLWLQPELYAHDREARLLNIIPPLTRWMNLGWWDTVDGTEEFPVAAERLARKLYEAVDLRKGERVCDVGFGAGESVRLLADEFQPAKLSGVTSLKYHQQRAVELALRTGLEREQCDLIAGDAATALAHWPPKSVDALFALDCAYHFDTRQRFLEDAYTLLDSGGRLALTDLILAGRRLAWWEHSAIRLLFLVAGIPQPNLLTPKEYVATLENMGFENVQLDDISAHVFPGYSAFVARRDRQLGDVLHPSHWGGLLGYTKLVRWYADLAGGGKRPRLAFVMVTARKRPA